MKKAFSLIELLIVILIIGIVYTISVSGFKRIKNSDEKLTLEILKSYLQKIPHTKSVKIECVDECLKCNIFVDEKKSKKIDTFVDKNVKSYRYDFSYGMVELEKEDNVCFSYTINKEGVGEQIFVEFKGKVYDFSSYLGKTPVYNSITEALEAKEKLFREVLK